MINKKLTLSIVIPVFNEEDYLADCLDSISAQSELPDEVIVVDNNCTDRSMLIAKKYPFVTVIQEKKQHQAFAQKTGFDHANGDILGRIDADSVLPVNWTYKVKREFSLNPDIVAIAGGGWPYDVSLKQLAVKVFGFYNNLASSVAGNRVLWGANCALKRSAWHKIRDRVLLRNDIWEDYDISLLLATQGKIINKPEIIVGASFRAVHKSFFTQAEYQFRAIRTYYLRKGIFRAALLLLVWQTTVLFYPLVLLDEKILKPLSTFQTRRREVLESSALLD